jgi:hypothetical protein
MAEHGASTKQHSADVVITGIHGSVAFVCIGDEKIAVMCRNRKDMTALRVTTESENRKLREALPETNLHTIKPTEQEIAHAIGTTGSSDGTLARIFNRLRGRNRRN